MKIVIVSSKLLSELRNWSVSQFFPEDEADAKVAAAEKNYRRAVARLRNERKARREVQRRKQELVARKGVRIVKDGDDFKRLEEDPNAQDS